MKATELMIGDWVMFKDPTDGSKYPVRLKSINANSCCGIEGKSLLSLTDDFEPIPITGEILKKNGFTKSKVFEEWKYKSITYKPFPLYFISIMKDSADLKLCNCVYVHELQQSLRLCGIKKEIKL